MSDKKKMTKKYHPEDNISDRSHGAKKKKKKSHWKEVVIVIVSLSMVVSMLLPAFSSIFGASKKQETPTFSSIKEAYDPQIETLKSAWDKDTKSKDAALALADGYYNYGSQAQNYTTSDEERTAVKELFTKGIAAYDKYLALVDDKYAETSRDALVHKALCSYYNSDFDSGISILKDLLEHVDYANAWGNLGIMYESKSDNESALDAYKKAQAATVGQTDNIKSYCAGRQKAIEQTIENQKKQAEEQKNKAANSSDSASSDSASKESSSKDSEGSN